MTGDTLLWRQIHPGFVQNGQVTSQAFRPTPKDQDRLSVYDGDRITAEAAWEHYTETLHLLSHGVMAVSVAECDAQALPVEADGRSFPEHVSIIFAGLTISERERRAKRLREAARARGWQYRATAWAGEGAS